MPRADRPSLMPNAKESFLKIEIFSLTLSATVQRSRLYAIGLSETDRKSFHATLKKALNRYLKYLWCLGELPMPPHRPIGSIVLKMIPEFAEECWTQLDSPKRYMAKIGAAKRIADEDYRPLVEWELEAYNDSIQA